MIHYAIVNEYGEVEGQYCKIGASTNPNAFVMLEVPLGRKKVLLTQEEYQILTYEYDEEKLAHKCKIDLLESKIIAMTEAEVDEVVNRRPEWVRDVEMSNGKIKREKKDGTIWEVLPDNRLTSWVIEENSKELIRK